MESESHQSLKTKNFNHILKNPDEMRNLYQMLIAFLNIKDDFHFIELLNFLIQIFIKILNRNISLNGISNLMKV